MQVAMMVSRWEYSTRPLGNNLKMALLSFNVRTSSESEAGPAPHLTNLLGVVMVWR